MAAAPTLTSTPHAPSHAPSYYAASGLPQPDRPPLQGSHQADVCVVGAGYTGLSSALHLAERGFKVIVLEAARVGWGASGRNGGQLVHSYSRDMDVIEARHGLDTARALGSMAFEGAQIIKERVARYHIDCHLRHGGVFAANTAKQLGHLHSHKALWERYGHPQLRLLGREQTIALTGSERHVGALGQVQAKFVIVAGNAYLGGLEPALAAKSMPCGTQIVATEPLGDRWPEILPEGQCVEDCNFLLDYYRLSADRRLLYGGDVVYGARDPARIDAVIRPKLEATFPQLKGIKLDYAWTGNFLLTLSRLPQVGRLAPNIYYSQGCSGHGVTFTHLIGRVLSEVIGGQAERFDTFASLPHLPFPGGRALQVPFTALGAWYYDLRDKLGL